MKTETALKIQASDLVKNTNYDQALALLEEAHILSQYEAWPHTYVHWKMFLLAFKYNDWKEVLGQIPRLILAAPGSITGRAPKGNVGTTKMGIFEIRRE